MPDVFTALAPAKLNLTLEVLGRRPDGYHEIDTVLQTIALADEVTVAFGRGRGLSVEGPFKDGTPLDDSNLALAAAHAAQERGGPAVESLHVGLVKRIPPAGGLGGGASDAATVLRLLQDDHGALSPAAAAAAAAAVGSDEPFFLVGGTARARGRGEVVLPLPDIDDHGVVLFIPPTTIERKTARMFAAIDALPFDDGRVARAFAAERRTVVASRDVFNAFERVAFDVFPGLAPLWEQLEARIGDAVHLAGAGPTLFWIGPPADTMTVAATAAGLDCTVIPTSTAGSPWRR
ncbi:MAG: 4-(cytidine 5'-diphospho)-2-C-methyl-D-erythritol kinase [Chloroflexi bacterium]|nr:4-(cytidine 5'-diphospho)-2-C-methyl-D-erythritol kinase [Chloroflexota bacterium]